MQLDQTHVVIRLRKFTEIGDLSLIMMRRYPEALLIGFVTGAIGWAITNMILLGWIPWEESSYGLDDQAAFGEVSRYLVWMTLQMHGMILKESSDLLKKRNLPPHHFLLATAVNR